MENLIPQTNVPVDFTQTSTTVERATAIIDLNTLNRLVASLQSSDFYSIKRSMRSAIDNCSNMEEMLLVMENEVSFYKTVNAVVNTSGYVPPAVAVAAVAKTKY